MALDQRMANKSWAVRTADDNYFEDPHYPYASLATLMDIRDELRKLNQLLGCPNFTSVPFTLRQIAKNTTQKRRRRQARMDRA